jgi:hypothetical protein
MASRRNRGSAVLGGERWAVEFAAGSALSLEETIAEALGDDGEADGRGME